MPQINKKSATKITTKKKLQHIHDFVNQGPALEKQLSDEYITLNGLNEQKSALDNFTLYENTGAGLLEKYDMVPGTDLYNIIVKLKEIEFDKLTQNQKKMILLILYMGIFEGVYELFAGRDQSRLSNQQRVALNLMGQDVEKIKTNIVPVLNKIEKTGGDAELEKKFHQIFDAYAPQTWGPRKTRYDKLVLNQCAEWSAEPDKNMKKILAHKDYMLVSLLPESLPALFRLMYDGTELSMRSESVDGWFNNFRSVSGINILISRVCAWGWPNEYMLGPSVTLWMQNMHAGMENGILESEKKIEDLTTKQANWKQIIDKMYKQLPLNNPINKVEKGKKK